MAASAEALPVKITGLAKHYGSVRAVDDVSFAIRPGEFVTLLGPSGSGKTTLLMMMAGFARPTAGSIIVGDQEIVRLPPHKRDIGMVFQNYALFPHMTVGQNIAYPLRLRRVGKTAAAERVARVLDLVQLAGYEERRVDQLSGGQRQRIALARAIVFEPRILLMDEPLSALDKQLRERMQIEIRRLHDRLGTTTIAVTHDQREALTMSDRVAVLHRGRLMQIAAPRDLYERPTSRFVAEFIGESNFLHVEVKGDCVSYAGQRIRLAEPPSAGSGWLQLVLRPEKLEFAGPGADGDALNLFSGQLTDVVFQGESVLMEVRLSGGEEVNVRLPNRQLSVDSLPSLGSKVTLAMHPQDARLVPEVA
jgi:putative spermidine/putrescine transport system ATP-binding protein